jgi:hypothetical protein
MERRDFLKIALGVTVGVAALAASAQAAPLMPQAPHHGSAPGMAPQVQPAVTTTEEISQLKPEEVRWHGHGHWGHRHWGWHHRHWGWHHRHWGWRHRHWGWRHRHWGWRHHRRW